MGAIFNAKNLTTLQEACIIDKYKDLTQSYLTDNIIYGALENYDLWLLEMKLAYGLPQNPTNAQKAEFKAWVVRQVTDQKGDSKELMRADYYVC